MRFFEFLVPFVVLVGVLIFVHEMGHFLALRLFGVRVIRFSLGFGPALLRWQRGETEYRISAVPLGGYVKMLGEDPADVIEAEDQGRAFHQKPRWQRAMVVLAGPVFNLILPVPFYFVFFAAQQRLPPAIIGTVLEGSPAAEAGLQADDKIVEIDGDSIRYWSELEERIRDSIGESLDVVAERDRKTHELTVAPRAHVVTDRLGVAHEVGRIGVSPRYTLPQIGVRDDESPAGKSGLRTFDVVIAVNGRRVDRWADLERILKRSRGEMLRIVYLRAGEPLPFADVRVMSAGNAIVIPEPLTPDPAIRRKARYDTGIEPADLFISGVEKGSPAERMGLRPGDRILRFDGVPVVHWESIVMALEASPDKEFLVTWRSPDGLEREARFVQQARTLHDDYGLDYEVRVFGARHRLPWRMFDPVPIEGRFGYAIGQAISRTTSSLNTMIVGFIQLLRGEIPSDSVGGPAFVVYMAGIAANKGLLEFLEMLTLISVNLGLLNLLPLLPLDGGHLFFIGLETVRGRPIGASARTIAHYAGLALLVALMVFALRNDVARFLFS